MASLTGVLPKNSYKDLLQVSNSNSGVDATLRQVSDGEDTSAAAYLSTTQLGILKGTAATPSFAFQPDPNTGLWMASTGQMEFVAAGVQSFRAVDKGIRLQDGTLATPAMAFVTDIDTGIWSPTVGGMDLVTAGAKAIGIDGAGIVTEPLKPSVFVEAAAQTQKTGDDTDYTLLWTGSEILDQNSDFATSIWTAPVTGLYGGVLLLSTEDTASNHTDFHVSAVASNRTLSLLLINGANLVSGDGSESLRIALPFEVDMDAADTLTFLFDVAGGSKIIDIVQGTHLSIHLIH